MVQATLRMGLFPCMSTASLNTVHTVFGSLLATPFWARSDARHSSLAETTYVPFEVYGLYSSAPSSFVGAEAAGALRENTSRLRYGDTSSGWTTPLLKCVVDHDGSCSDACDAYADLLSCRKIVPALLWNENVVSSKCEGARNV